MITSQVTNPLGKEFTMTKARLLIAGLSLALVAFVGVPALAFHDGGVADCAGCHTMHNSQDGVAVDAASPLGNSWLLRDATPSDVCLNCHATGLGAVFAADVMTPSPLKGAGNFIFLLEDNLNDGHNGGLTDPNGVLLEAIPGDAAGHNLKAPGHGLAADATLSTAPGGLFPASELGCSSCHDPHGNSGFRMLYGSGRIVQAGLAVFTEAAPPAAGLSIFFGSESKTSHTAYQGTEAGANMSKWCSNCHGNFHSGADGVLRHKTGETLGATVATTYGLYNGSDSILGGSALTSYLPEVPFEDPANTTSSTAGPSASSLVSCITCHRAHASSAADSGRWDFQVTFLHEDGDESLSYELPDPYASVNQRSLCNKCHKKDEFDAPF